MNNKDFDKTWKDLNNIDDEQEDTLEESLADMTIEEIMAEGGVSRELATALYEAEHGINLSEPMTFEEAIEELERMVDEINKK